MPVKRNSRRAAPAGGSPAGYSGTPLAKKLSLKDGMTVWAPGMPASVRQEIETSGLDLTWARRSAKGLAAAHLFVTERGDLERVLGALRSSIDPAGMVWVSWPKKSSGVATTITEDTIREVALPAGWVDIKVCAVDAVWSGLKLVIRKDLRG